MLREPAPSASELETAFELAMRAPDHGGMKPWRFVTVQGEVRAALARGAAAVFPLRAADLALRGPALGAELDRLREACAETGMTVPMVTTNAAAMIGKQDEIGTLKPGVDADVSVLADQRGKFLLRDNEKNQVVAERLLQPLFCLRAGKRYDADASILPEAIAA